MPPRVSFIVPCYNYGRYLVGAVESLLSQTFKSLEVIVIDDASTDNTADVVRAYDGHPRVRVIRHPQNQGHIATYNEGIALVRGEFVGLLSADDYAVHEDAVARQVAVFDAHPSVGFVHSAYRIVDHSGEAYWLNRPEPADYVRTGLEEFSRLIWGNYVSASGTLVRRSAHALLGGYDPRLPHAGDWELWLRVATRLDVAYLADALYAYRMHGSNMSIAGFRPGMENSELLLTIELAFAALPESAPAELRALEGPARWHAALKTSADDRTFGRIHRSWAGLLDAVWRSPSLLTSPRLYSAVTRLVLLTVVGYPRYVRLSEWRSGRIQRGHGSSPVGI